MKVFETKEQILNSVFPGGLSEECAIEVTCVINTGDYRTPHGIWSVWADFSRKGAFQGLRFEMTGIIIPAGETVQHTSMLHDPESGVHYVLFEDDGLPAGIFAACEKARIRLEDPHWERRNPSAYIERADLGI